MSLEGRREVAGQQDNVGENKCSQSSEHGKYKTALYYAGSHVVLGTGV